MFTSMVALGHKLAGTDTTLGVSGLSKQNRHPLLFLSPNLWPEWLDFDDSHLSLLSNVDIEDRVTSSRSLKIG